MADDYGFLAYNLNNSVVIDSSFVNYVLKTTGSTNVVAGINYISLPNTNDKVLFAFRPPSNYYVAHWGYKFTSNTLTHARVIASGPTTLQWVMFQEVPAAVPTNTYGMVTYDSAGQVTFSTEENYLKMHKDYEGNVDQTFVPTSLTNYFFTWSPMVKVEWNYYQQRDELTFDCNGAVATYSQRAAIITNYRKSYCVGIKKDGANIRSGWILHNTQPAVLNPTLARGSYATCNGVTRYFYGKVQSNVNVEQSDDQLKFSEILDPNA